ncbi:MAG: COG3650 family protein [Novosphingobium sp.]
MRSGVVLALLLVAGCDRKTTVEIKSEQDSVATPVADATGQIEIKLADPAKEKRYQALGTEPFWSVEIMPGKLRYSTPDNPDGIAFPASETALGTGTRYSGMMDGKAFAVTIEPGPCSDGMSDTAYPYKAVLTIEGRAEQGCARER